MKLLLTISALAMSVDTALCQTSNTVVLPTATVSNIANAIFRAEGIHSTHPYGVMIPCTSPRVVCINTIQHAWRLFEGENHLNVRGESMVHGTTLPFIQFLGSRYCPPSVDPAGYKNWTNNVFRIVNKQTNKTI